MVKCVEQIKWGMNPSVVYGLFVQLGECKTFEGCLVRYSNTTKRLFGERSWKQEDPTNFGHEFSTKCVQPLAGPQRLGDRSTRGDSTHTYVW